MLYVNYFSDEFLTKLIMQVFSVLKQRSWELRSSGYCTLLLVVNCWMGHNIQEQQLSKFIKLNSWGILALHSTGIDHNKIPEDNSNIKFYWNPSNSLRHRMIPPLCNTFMFWTLCRVESVRSVRLSYNCNVFYLLQVLYRELGLTASKLSFKHRHPGTSKEALMQIKRDHPLPEIILQWRKLNSILTKVLWIWWSLLIPCSNSWTYKSMKESCAFIIYVVWYWLQMNVVKLQSKLISGNWNLENQSVNYNNFQLWESIAMTILWII